MRIMLYVVLAGSGIPALLYFFWLVHCALNAVCIRHARNFCIREGLEVRRTRCQPAFEHSGIKTEYTLVQLDCIDANKQRRLLLLLTWPLGVRKKLSDETYPMDYDEQWPDTSHGR